MSSLSSKQIQTECLFDDPQPFFPPQNQKHNEGFFFSIYSRSFFPTESQASLDVLLWRSVSMKLDIKKRANYSSLLIFAGLCVIPLRAASTAIFVQRDAQISCKFRFFERLPAKVSPLIHRNHRVVKSPAGFSILCLRKETRTFIVKLVGGET